VIPATAEQRGQISRTCPVITVLDGGYRRADQNTYPAQARAPASARWLGVLKCTGTQGRRLPRPGRAMGRMKKGRWVCGYFSLAGCGAGCCWPSHCR